MLENNIITAIINLVQNPITELLSTYQSNNRANSMGDALEEYVKDLFADTFDIENETERIEKLSEVFSYLGNEKNPPDSMLKNGDAIEVKKIEKENSALALNSSYPKHKLYASSNMISKACKEAEEWKEKDIIYITGVVDKHNKLHSLSFVYGADYCASEECYTKIKSTIKNGVESIPGVEFSETKELGRVNKVDPLGITYLRVRGMWGIENPWTVFDYICHKDTTKDFNFMCLINDDKWNTLNNTEDLLALTDERLIIKDVKIKNPDNPAKLRTGKLITFSL